MQRVVFVHTAMAIFFSLLVSSCNLSQPLTPYSEPVSPSIGTLIIEPYNTPTPTFYISTITSNPPTITQLTTAIDLSSQTKTPTIMVPWNPCDGSYASRLQVNMRAQVSSYPPLSNRVRSGAGINFTILGTIGPGEIVTIIGGPACSNNWVWWQVRSESNNLEGWTAEGDLESYWLIPLT